MANWLINGIKKADQYGILEILRIGKKIKY